MFESARHQCLIYEGPSSPPIQRIAPLIIKKLGDGNRCLFLGHPGMVAHMRADLETMGLNVPIAVEETRLILSSEPNHLLNGRFDTDRMLNMLKDAVHQAQADGFKGLWASGDMTWEFGPEDNLQKLLDYECGLEKLFRTLPALSGICQYHKDTLPLDMIGNALYTHQTLYINHTLQRVNPFYLQPEALLKHRPPRQEAFEIERMLHEAAAL